LFLGTFRKGREGGERAFAAACATRTGLDVDAVSGDENIKKRKPMTRRVTRRRLIGLVRRNDREE
jgi:hypothetical protein